MNMLYLSMFTFCRDLGAFAGNLSEGYFGHFSKIYHISLFVSKLENITYHLQREEKEKRVREERKESFFKTKKTIQPILRATIYRVRVRNSIILCLCTIMCVFG